MSKLRIIKKIMAAKKAIRPYVPKCVNSRMNDFVDWLYDSWDVIG